MLIRSEKVQNPHLSVIIPCYNEEKNLEMGKLDEVYTYLVDQKYAWEVIIVNDESTDNSRSLINRFIDRKSHFYLLDISHAGKPAGIWAGIQEAKGELVLFMDMDQSTPIEELDKLLPWYEKGFDVVIGSRGTSRRGFSIIRRVGSVIFRNLRRFFLLRNIIDTQCGFKSCRRRVAMEIFPRLQYFRQRSQPKGWKVSAYDVELLYLIERADYRLKEVVVKWSHRDQSDTKRYKSELVRYVSESIEMADEVIRVKLNQLRGLYDEVGESKQ